jgi:hypothetical protein
LAFRTETDEILIARLARARQAMAGGPTPQYDVLSRPHRFSPFLTLAERRDRQRDALSSWVVKILVVLAEDASIRAWRGVLDRERSRWQEELERRLRFEDGVRALGLPLSVRSTWRKEGLVQTAILGPIRRAEILDELSPPVGADLEFSYLVRPFIPWPRLGDVGYSRTALDERWKAFCERVQLPYLKSNRQLFRHFCDEALINGDSDLLLTSAWRFKGKIGD